VQHFAHAVRINLLIPAEPSSVAPGKQQTSKGAMERNDSSAKGMLGNELTGSPDPAATSPRNTESAESAAAKSSASVIAVFQRAEDTPIGRLPMLAPLCPMSSVRSLSLHSFILRLDPRPQTACVKVAVGLWVTLFSRLL
jgi:hypothetical protein